MSKILATVAVAAALAPLVSCSWPPGSAAPPVPPVQQPAEQLENRRPGELPTVDLPPTPDPRLPRGVL